MTRRSRLQLLTSLCEEPPDLIVITGDLTQRGWHWQFAAARDYLEKLPKPMVGNTGQS